jgi:hypothetical protein
MIDRSQITVTLQVTAEQRAAYDAAAERCGDMSRQAWCKAVLDAAAGLSELPKQMKRAGVKP